MTRRPVAVVAFALLLPLLSACGGQSYCDTVKAHQSELGSIAGSGRRTALLQALPIFEDLQGKAPGDVADDWQLVVTRIRALKTALEQAHVDPASYDPQRPPAGLSGDERARIREAAAGLAAPDTAQALANVQQEVLDVCHTPLEL
jgi:hypothetical protein